MVVDHIFGAHQRAVVEFHFDVTAARYIVGGLIVRAIRTAHVSSRIARRRGVDSDIHSLQHVLLVFKTETLLGLDGELSPPAFGARVGEPFSTDGDTAG